MEEVLRTAHKVVEIMDGMSKDTVVASENMGVGVTVGEDTAASMDLRKVATTRDPIRDTTTEEDTELIILTLDRLGSYFCDAHN